MGKATRAVQSCRKGGRSNEVCWAQNGCGKKWSRYPSALCDEVQVKCGLASFNLILLLSCEREAHVHESCVVLSGQLARTMRSLTGHPLPCSRARCSNRHLSSQQYATCSQPTVRNVQPPMVERAVLTCTFRRANRIDNHQYAHQHCYRDEHEHVQESPISTSQALQSILTRTSAARASAAQALTLQVLTE